jgi:hypothetical protein
MCEVSKVKKYGNNPLIYVRHRRLLYLILKSMISRSTFTVLLSSRVHGLPPYQ